MRQALIILLLTGLTIPNSALAQKHRRAELRIGFSYNVSEGRVSGPQYVREFPYGTFYDVPFEKRFRMVTAPLYVGIGLQRWKVTPGISVLYGGIESPRAGVHVTLTGWQLCVRYAFLAGKLWRQERFALYGLCSLARIYPVTERSLRGYSFNRPFFLPEVGVGANASILHAEIKLHAWPGLVVGEAAEPGSHDSFTWKPIRLNYAVSILLGIEFMLLKL